MDSSSKSPWHAGEKQLQARFKVAERMELVGQKVIRDHLPEQHRTFYGQLPFIVVGAVDDHGQPWATLLEGAEGFASSPDPHRLLLASLAHSQDPASTGLRAGRAIGLLGIELHSRRRNRLNGSIRCIDSAGIEVEVEQSYGNCPKYIQPRAFTHVGGPARERPETFDGLTPRTQEMIRAADTFFIASHVEHDDGRHAVDVSHRGGRPGFIAIEGNRLIVPDYSGNQFFNTLGNLLLNPVAGLLFIDFASGDLLQVAGRTELLLDDPRIQHVEGAERLWSLDVERVVLRRAATALRWAPLTPA
ncbi:hypothetical protein SAMN05444352_122106 [Pseudomonas japonica]|uniref:Pyridoxamine 5'-phosphate oxidase N-terminal domain-containing protein n=1 Tax=Pseudomonas japonica TaxID=256466 RepID=A0A239JM24_9PSED|nr:hypothetical protein SAMN05444352_122106 [Pseudomonas japonica]